MRALAASGAVTGAVTAMASALDRYAPHLVPGYRAALPAAGRVVTERLVAAAYREGLRTPDAGGAAGVVAGVAVRAGRRHAFGRVAAVAAEGADPVLALAGIAGCAAGPGGHPLAAELADAVANLALAMARRPTRADLRATAGPACTGEPAGLLDLAATLPADEQVLLFERLGTEGHNLHPCGRTRLGWSPTDVLAHDLEALSTGIEFVAVRRDVHLGDDLAALLRPAYPHLPEVPAGYVLTPVHPWQANLVRRRYRDLVADGTVRPVDGPALPAAPTAALRTLLLPPGADGSRWYLKVSLDIQVTSTRRTISVASTRNAVALSELIGGLLADQGAALLGEVGGSAVDAGTGRDRDLAAIARVGLAGRLLPGEVAIPALALSAVSPLTGRPVVDELVAAHPGGPLAFLADYAGVLLPPLLRLLSEHGIALEAHLQNSMVTFAGGRPTRLIMRDVAGLRVHRPRLAAAGHRLTLWPGSVVGTDDLEVVRAKLAYTAFQAHLGELVAGLVDGHGCAEAEAWRVIGAVVAEALTGRRGDGDRARRAAADRAWLTAPSVPHKALVRMRLAGSGGDRYVPVPNPLAGPG